MEFAVATHHSVIKMHNLYLTARNAETTRNYERRMKIRWRGVKMKYSVIILANLSTDRNANSSEIYRFIKFN